MAPGGYAWWYVDALSDDGRHGLAIIAFIGSVFSPYYAAARRRGTADPSDHVAFNVALYGPGARWSMTERSASALACRPDFIRIGLSSISCGPGRIDIAIDEWAVPIPRRLRGRVSIETGPVFHQQHRLDATGGHLWRPVAPFARVHAVFDAPQLQWRGHAYVDSNRGDEPLENAFRYWTWSRARAEDRTTVFYDVERRDGSRQGLALALTADGKTSAIEPPPVRDLPSGLWGVRRNVRSQEAPSAMSAFEDAPFYTRTSTGTVVDGQVCPTVCESVDLDRFASRWVQMLLPFRMPRRG